MKNLKFNSERIFLITVFTFSFSYLINAQWTNATNTEHTGTAQLNSNSPVLYCNAVFNGGIIVEEANNFRSGLRYSIQDEKWRFRAGKINTYPKMTFNMDSGRLGIGYDDPDEKLHIWEGGAKISTSSTGGSTHGLEWFDLSNKYLGGIFQYGSLMQLKSGSTGDNNRILLSTNDHRAMIFGTNGKVGIGEFLVSGIWQDPAEELEVRGNAMITGELMAASDKKLKTNINDLHGALASINLLRSVDYELLQNEYSDLNLPGGKQYGFLAQEVEEILPDLVKTYTKLGTDIKAINYTQFIPFITAAIQELDNVIMDQRSEMKQQKDLILSLISRIENLENK